MGFFGPQCEGGVRVAPLAACASDRTVITATYAFGGGAPGKRVGARANRERQFYPTQNARCASAHKRAKERWGGRAGAKL